MGLIFSSLFKHIFGTKETRILILGLDNAGKTTILYRLKVDQVVSTTPTIGFNVESVQYKNILFQVWDLGGQSSIRPYWRCYFPDTNAVVYVVDSLDRDRLPDSREELTLMLEEEELAGVPLLIFANKQDLSNAMTVAEVSEGLGLTEIRNRQWAIFQTSALRGSGILEGFEWLCTCLAAS